MAGDDELAERTAGVVSDQGDVVELEGGHEVGDQLREPGRGEVGAGLHRGVVRAERQVGVQGDDPLPDSISLRADGPAALIRGGAHGGFRSECRAQRAVAARATRLAEHAPWKALDGSTVTPGGFGGWDNDMRYMLRRGQRSVTVSDADMPRRIRPLIHMLDAIIENDTGRIVSSELHSGLIPSAGIDAAEGP